MVPTKQGTRFGFSRWSKQEHEIFRKFLVAYYDENSVEPLFAPEYRRLHEKVRLAGFDKSARDVYLRYFTHWKEGLGFPTVRQWCTTRVVSILTMVERHTEIYNFLKGPSNGMQRIIGKISFRVIHLECEDEERRRFSSGTDEGWAKLVHFRRLSPSTIQTGSLRWKDVISQQDNWASLCSERSHYSVLPHCDKADTNKDDLREYPT